MNDLPTNFDVRDQWPNCIHPILSQGKCGGCWAFGTTEVLSDRLCIASNGEIDVRLSPQYLISCDYSNFGCDGGIPTFAWETLESKGAVTGGCYPY